jgi:hypothetical protein
LLRSQAGAEYYLLREFDPKNPEELVHWYLAEEISQPTLFDPKSFNNLAVGLWNDRQGQKIPYPELDTLGRHYYFEFQTQGTYEGNMRETSRITWDYWDKSHQWNLAIEAWSNGQLPVYSTKLVNPEEFSEVNKGIGIQLPTAFPILEFVGACGLVLVGLFMLIFG